MDEPPTPDQLRELVALALRADLQKAIPPWRPFPGGPPLSPGMGRTEYDLADAALAVVQPELGRLRAELAAADDEMTAVMLHNDQTCEAVAERDRLRAELEQARDLVRDLADPDPCDHFDHHGYCQTHGWFAVEPPCPHGRAQQAGLVHADNEEES